jgi:BCD family chlorophyll transporter-like MFS transporter
MHTTQTAGLALATDLARPDTRPKVVAMLCVMLLSGICIGAVSYGLLLRHFSELRLIQVVQGSALLTFLINGTGMWQQEPRSEASQAPAPKMSAVWRKFRAEPRALRRLVTIGLGTMALSMQDILLEPYGGQVLHLSVSQTTLLTAALAGGGLTGLAIASRLLSSRADPYAVAALGLLVGLVAFVEVIFSGPLSYPPMFVMGVLLIGLAAGMFLAGTLSDAMGRASAGNAGLALGTWGSVQAGAAGLSIAIGGFIRDGAGYDTVYILEIVLLFVTLAALGPLVRRAHTQISLQPQS